MPQGAIYVGRGSRWGNLWVLGQALARVPALDGSVWEPEGRISAHGCEHPYHHPDGRISVHTSWRMSPEQVVETFRCALLTPTKGVGLYDRRTRAFLTAADARADLAGCDLACWCPLNRPCHGDVLLAVANQNADGQA